MDADTKYKRWGWGAVAGLIGVILIAGLIVAVSMSSPKPNANVEADASQTSVNEQIAVEDGGDSSDQADKSGSDQSGTSKTEDEKAAEQRAAEQKAAEEKAAREKAEAEAKAAEDAKKKAAEQNSGSSNSDSGSPNTKNMPKTGPADNMISIVALAVIAGLAVYNISLKR